MLAATLAEGTTVIRPAAQEPEVDDLIAFLQKMGAEVERTAPDTIVVEGRRRLRGAEHNVIADRIEAGHVRRRRGRHRRRGDHRDRAVRAPGRVPRRRSSTACRRRLRHATRSRSVARRVSGDYAPRHRDGALSGTRHRPPAAHLGAAQPGQRHEPAPRDDLRGPPRVAGRAAPAGRAGRDARRPPRLDHTARPPARRRGRDGRPARRRLADPWPRWPPRARASSTARTTSGGGMRTSRQVPRSRRADRARLGGSAPANP